MTGEPRFGWCETCGGWVGSEPPMLPPYWSNEKAAAMHRKGTGHKVKLLDMAAVLDVCRHPVLDAICRAQAAQAKRDGYRDAETRYYPESAA